MFFLLQMGAKFILSRLCFIAGAAETKFSQSSYDMIQMLGAHLQNTSSTSTNFKQHFDTSSYSGGGGGGGSSNTNGSSGGFGPKCSHCGKIYSNYSNLRQHVRNVHVSVDKSLWHTCPTCLKKLKTKHYLINHQLQAHGIHQRGSGSNANYLTHSRHNESI